MRKESKSLIAFTHRGGLLSRLRFADSPGNHCAYGIHRGDLFSVLHDAVLSAGVDLRLNHQMTRIENGGRRLIDIFGKSFGGFDLIIVADGSRSRLLDSCGVRAFVHSYQPAALWAVAQCRCGSRTIASARPAHAATVWPYCRWGTVERVSSGAWINRIGRDCELGGLINGNEM